MRTERLALPALFLAALVLASCGPAEEEFQDFEKSNRAKGKIAGGLEGLFSSGDDERASGSGIAVNSYLWRASLDTMSFMPLSSADPFGGVIITDWYTPPDSPDERFKVNLYILGRQLRADGLRASVFRQVRGPQGNWQDAKVDEATATKLENAILAQARELRIATAENE